jgi:hypothetical protein
LLLLLLFQPAQVTTMHCLLVAALATIHGLRATFEAHPPGVPTTCEAWVHGRRVLSKSVAFLTLGDGEASHDVQSILKRGVLATPPSATFKQAVQLAAPGARVRLFGTIKTHE